MAGGLHIRRVDRSFMASQNEAILLTHFSQRYSAEAIIQHLDKTLPAGLRSRCTPLLQGYA